MSRRYIRASRFLLRAAAALALAGMAGLAGCTPVGVAAGAGATAGVAASEERGIKGTISDARIRIEINDAWLNADFDIFNDVALQIYEGRVLLTGLVGTQEQADTAVRLAWQAEGVREVINEIGVGAGGGIAQFADDSVINARLDGALLFEKGVSSINYSTRAVGGTVYLLGVAQSREELDRVFTVVRSIPKVKGVISHVVMRDDPRRFREPGAAPDEYNAGAGPAPTAEAPAPAASQAAPESAPQSSPRSNDVIETRPLPDPQPAR